MPKRGKRSNKRRGSSSELKDGSQKSDGSQNASGDASHDELETSSVEVPLTNTASSVIPVPETSENAPASDDASKLVDAAPKDDLIIDPTGISPFLTPSGLAASKNLVSESSSKEVDLVFSPGSDADAVAGAFISAETAPAAASATIAESAADIKADIDEQRIADDQVLGIATGDAVVSESPIPILGDSPETSQTAFRQSPPIPSGEDDDLLRQSVDLAGISVPTTPAKISAVAEASAAQEVTENGGITVTIEPLEVPAAVSPDGSIPLSNSSPVPYPKSPAQPASIVVPGTPSVLVPGATPTAASVPIPETPSLNALTSKTPKGGSVSMPATPSVVVLSSSTPKTSSMAIPTTPSVVNPEPIVNDVVNGSAKPSPARSLANPPAPSVVILDEANTTMHVSPATPSLSIPPIPVVEDPSARSTSRDRISAFISANEGAAGASSPPRGVALDSIALNEDPALASLAAPKDPAPVPITKSMAGPEPPFMSIDFDTAHLRLTGRTGKSVRLDQTAVTESSGGLFGMCKTCFGLKKSVKLTKDLSEDRDMQTTLISTPFDPQFEIHRRMLQTVYASVSGKTGNVSLKGDHWKSNMGFKSHDPATDLNEKGSGGVFSVLCMLYLSQEFKAEVSSMKDRSRFAAASILLSNAVSYLVKAGKLNSMYNNQRQVTHVTCHVFAAMFKKSMQASDKLEAAALDSVIAQAQTEAGLAQIVELVPFPHQVAVTEAKP